MIKSPHCRTRWHDRCPHEITNSDGSAFICVCDCHVNAVIVQERDNKEWIEKITDLQGVPAALATTPIYHPPVEEQEDFPRFELPPPYPEPFARGRYRLAADRPGLARENPWRAVRCRECNYPCGTQEYELRWLSDIICEDCLWRRYEELIELDKKRGPISAA